jgi:hypothetical protein
MKNINMILAVGTVAAVCGAAEAGITSSGSYIFPASQTSGSSYVPMAYNGSTIANLSPGQIGLGSGVTWGNSNGNLRATAWALDPVVGSLSGNFDANDYIGFTLTADSGYTLDLNSITFGIGRSGSGPRTWQWRSSVDNFVSALAGYTTVASGLTNSSGILTNPDSNSSWTGNVLSFSGSSFSGLTSITLRLYGYNSEGAGGTGGLQGPLGFSVTMNQVPAPGAMALLGVAGLLGARRRR